jgi:hypothetical protein
MLLKDTSRRFDPVPEGLYAAVAVDVVDLGLTETPWGPKPKLQITWELDLINPQTQRRYILARWFGANLSEKGALRPFLEAWRGKKFTREELAGFDPEILVGVNCQIQVVHKIKDDGQVTSQVQAIVGAPRGVPKIHPSKEFVRVKDRPGTPPASEGHVEDETEIPF